MSRILRHVSLAFGVTVLLGLAIQIGAAQRPEVKRVEGHLAPLMARITYPDKKSRQVMVLGVGYSTWTSHTMQATGEGDSEVTLWLDSIKAIKDTADKRMLVQLKNGTERELKIEISYSALLIANEDGGQEELPIGNVTSIEFLDAPRKDRDGNAMFDNWRYSPYTGERLADH